MERDGGEPQPQTQASPEPMSANERGLTEDAALDTAFAPAVAAFVRNAAGAEGVTPAEYLARFGAEIEAYTRLLNDPVYQEREARSREAFMRRVREDLARPHEAAPENPRLGQ